MNTEIKFNELTNGLNSKIAHQQDEYLYFGGTAYLGIPQNEAFINLFMEGVKRFGLNNGTSRGNNVQVGIYNEAEAFIAQKFGSESALVVSSGYLAAQLTVRALVKQGEVRYAPNTHPALWTDLVPQNTAKFDEWAKELVVEINESIHSQWVIITNSMNNLFPEIYDFSFLEEVNPDKKITLIIDDSHGIGILNDGQSVLQSVPVLPNVETVIVASMAKALGVDAGVVLGSIGAIQNLKMSNEFYGASPPAAAGLHAFIHANEVYKTAYQKLMENVDLFAKAVSENQNWHFVKGFPVFLAKEKDFSEKLQAQNILISSFPYPDKNGEVLNRIVISCWHKKDDIEKLIAAIA